MPSFTTAEVNHKVLSRRRIGTPAGIRSENVVRIQLLQDGTRTYPSGGIPLDKAKLGCPRTVDQGWVNPVASGVMVSGIKWDLDTVNVKLRALFYVNGQELGTSYVPAAQVVDLTVTGF